MTHSITEIDPGRLYSFSEAARLIPSCRQGKNLSLRTLHRWRTAGRIEAVCRQSGGRRFWFAYGSALLAFLSADQAPEWHGRTPTERRRAIERATRTLERMGIRVGSDHGG